MAIRGFLRALISTHIAAGLGQGRGLRDGDRGGLPVGAKGFLICGSSDETGVIPNWIQNFRECPAEIEFGCRVGMRLVTPVKSRAQSSRSEDRGGGGPRAGDGG